MSTSLSSVLIYFDFCHSTPSETFKSSLLSFSSGIFAKKLFVFNEISNLFPEECHGRKFLSESDRHRRQSESSPSSSSSSSSSSSPSSMSLKVVETSRDWISVQFLLHSNRMMTTVQPFRKLVSPSLHDSAGLLVGTVAKWLRGHEFNQNWPQILDN